VDRLNLYQQWVHRVLLTAGLSLVLVSAFFAYELFLIRNINALIFDPKDIDLSETNRPELVMAKAYYLQENGEPLESIRLYGPLSKKGPDEFRAKVFFNLGTLYLKDASKLWKTYGLHEYVRINTLLDAAKENFKSCLEIEPSHEGAKFNLEYAYRITPPPHERPKNNFQGNKSSVFSTLPSIPGGGP
jgi:mxaK protein